MEECAAFLPHPSVFHHGEPGEEEEWPALFYRKREVTQFRNGTVVDVVSYHSTPNCSGDDLVYAPARRIPTPPPPRRFARASPSPPIQVQLVYEHLGR